MIPNRILLEKRLNHQKEVHPSGFEPETFGSVVDAWATNKNAVGTGKTLV
jgi:hypothetical protein